MECGLWYCQVLILMLVQVVLCKTLVRKQMCLGLGLSRSTFGEGEPIYMILRSDFYLNSVVLSGHLHDQNITNFHSRHLLHIQKLTDITAVFCLKEFNSKNSLLLIGSCQVSSEILFDYDLILVDNLYYKKEKSGNVKTVLSLISKLHNIGRKIDCSCLPPIRYAVKSCQYAYIKRLINCVKIMWPRLARNGIFTRDSMTLEVFSRTRIYMFLVVRLIS